MCAVVCGEQRIKLYWSLAVKEKSVFFIASLLYGFSLFSIACIIPAPHWICWVYNWLFLLTILYQMFCMCRRVTAGYRAVPLSLIGKNEIYYRAFEHILCMTEEPRHICLQASCGVLNCVYSASGKGIFVVDYLLHKCFIKTGFGAHGNVPLKSRSFRGVGCQQGGYALLPRLALPDYLFLLLYIPGWVLFWLAKEWLGNLLRLGKFLLAPLLMALEKNVHMH